MSKNFKANFKVFLFDYGIYEADSDADYCLNQLFCLQDGQITVFAAGGGVFTWDAKTTHNKLNIYCKKVIVHGGIFMARGTSNTVINDVTELYWSDEAKNIYVDETGKYFVLV